MSTKLKIIYCILYFLTGLVFGYMYKVRQIKPKQEIIHKLGDNSDFLYGPIHFTTRPK